ncbi:MAG: glycosyltransferase, partial [Mariniphaga sp.]|nr:glycosyltransferase [Mariniphaga sp.]
GGVMRWLKMSKYLPGLGWIPVIYTPGNPDASVVDESLADEIHPQTEILKTSIWEPYEVFRKITGKKKGEKFKAGYISEASSGDWKNRLSVFIRGNFLIPDPRKFWIKPSVKFLLKYLKENPVDLIVSTGPPHSMHLIALRLKKRIDVPWIADFRDPWTDIDFYQKLRLTLWADKKHRKLELKVLKEADHIVTVSPHCANDLYKIPGKQVKVIYNGFDPADFKESIPVSGNKFSIAHFGAFNRDRNPAILWKVLGMLAKENAIFREKLSIRLIGQTDDSVIDDIKNNGLEKNLVQTDHLPHKKGLDELAQSQILLLPINDAPNAKGILPGKMYEYMALKRPILAIGPVNSDFAQILKETKAGAAVDFNDFAGLKESINQYFQQFQEGGLEVHSTLVEKYSRKNQAKNFMDLIKK